MRPLNAGGTKMASLSLKHIYKKYPGGVTAVSDFCLDIKDKVTAAGLGKVAAELGIGEPTLADIISELEKPGRDVRDEAPEQEFRDDILDMSDLKEGMVLTGTVRNVIDFGAFVDIGVHQDGLVHISQISNKYIKHPSEALSVGDRVTVKVLSVDVKKQRIGLTMKL